LARRRTSKSGEYRHPAPAIFGCSTAVGVARGRRWLGGWLADEVAAGLRDVRGAGRLLRVRAVEQFAVGSGGVGVLLSAGGVDHPGPVGERLRVGRSGPRTAEGPVGRGDRLQRTGLDVIGRDIEALRKILDGGTYVRSRLAGLFGGSGSLAGRRRRGVRGGGRLRWRTVAAVAAVATDKQQHGQAGCGRGGAETVAHGPRIVPGAAGVLSFLG